jgi:hypothetical protein
MCSGGSRKSRIRTHFRTRLQGFFEDIAGMRVGEQRVSGVTAESHEVQTACLLEGMGSPGQEENRMSEDWIAL